MMSARSHSKIPMPSVASRGSEGALDRVLAGPEVPLLPRESEADYRNLAAQIVSATHPNDAIEEILIRDVIDLTWETLRLRRTKAGMIRAAYISNMKTVLRSLTPSLIPGFQTDFEGPSELVKKWLSGNKDAEKEVAEKLAAARLTSDDVEAQSVESKLGEFERLDRMMASAEARRNNALREVERHREALGTEARRAVGVEDGECTDIESGDHYPSPD